MRKRSLFMILVVFFVLQGSAFAEFAYTVKKAHPGGDITPVEAHTLMQKDRKHVVLVDVRTRAEYALIGHAKKAYNIPYEFWTGTFHGRSYVLKKNDRFTEDLLARFDPKADMLLLMCRSGSRSSKACAAAVAAGWAPERVASVFGGFEGDKVRDKASPDYGKRRIGGWRNEGLPETYAVRKKYMYAPDVTRAGKEGM